MVTGREILAQHRRQSALPQPSSTRAKPTATVARAAPHLPLRVAGISRLPSPWGLR